MATVRDLGEFGVIQRIARVTPTSAAVVEGIGDDCAVVRVSDRLLLMSCDLLVENVHFRKGQVSAVDLGWKAAAACLSDVAAMGGTPLFCLVSLSCPSDTEVSFIEELYRGMSRLLTRYGAIIVGGDTTNAGDGIVIDVSVVGQLSDSRCLRRKGACAGDLLAVTGHLGLVAASVHALDHGHPIVADIIQRYQRPAPRIREGQWLCGCPEIHAMLDISDGLIQDAGHLGVAAELGVDLHPNGLSLMPHLKEYCDAHGLDPRVLMLTGGEDYELAFALDRAGHEETLEKFHHEFRTVVSVVGEFTDEWQGVRVDGKETDLSGFNHFE